MTASKPGGFSLTELLVTLGIVAVIVSSALPTWRSYLLATRRIDATSTLMHLAARQEQFRLQNQRYANASEISPDPPLGLGIAAIAASRYQLQLTAGNNSFSATATVNANASQADDLSCWVFGIDGVGRRWSSAADGQDTTALCWRI